MFFRYLIITFFIVIGLSAYAQQQPQDVVFHLNTHLLSGKKILKVKRDFNDYYVWVLAENNQVYRINSQTLVVDDYTASFAAYNTFKFTDIAGHSADTAIVVANTPNLIEYQSGTIRLFSSSDGIPGNVNSVGEDLGFGLNNYTSKGKMIFATDNGLRYLDLNTQQIQYLADVSPYASNSGVAAGKIYEATYRTETYKDSVADDASGWATDTMRYLPVSFYADDALEVSYIFEDDNQFGSDVNTVVNVNNFVYSSNPTFASFFWGTSKGMSQNYPAYSSNYAQSPHFHYLDGIKVNKITNIYGLTGFDYSYSSPAIKQNLLVGTDQGFYFSSSTYNRNLGWPLKFSLFHDDELGNVVINDINVNAEPNAKPICENGVWLATNDGLYLLKPDYAAYFNNQQQSSISFKNESNTLAEVQICSGTSITATANNGYTNIQWYKDGSELPAASNDTLAITQPGDYNAVIYDPCADVHMESNHLKVDMVSSPVFTFNYPDVMQYCDSTSKTLSATYSPAYSYRWYWNGVIIGNITPSITVTQPGRYKVEVSACNGNWVPSKEVQVIFNQITVPVISIDKPAYCMGDNATLTISASADPTNTINWYRGNVLLPDNTNKTSLVTNIAGSYTVTVVSKTINTDGTICSQSSLAQVISFSPVPQVSIQQTNNATLCQGQTTELKAIHTDGSVTWSTGENTDQIQVATAGIYKATLTTQAGCTADASINVAFFPNPVLSINDTTMCTYKNQALKLTAPSGFAQYTWNGQPGNQFYTINNPQTVNLTVTNANGCQASTQIHVTEQCPDVEIPNAFTPNGDGINDNWKIDGLNNTATINVFNRYGVQIYQSKGYATPWNGTYNGTRLPGGVYYYVIKNNNGKQTFSGSVTIIY